MLAPSDVTEVPNVCTGEKCKERGMVNNRTRNDQRDAWKIALIKKDAWKIALFTLNKILPSPCKFTVYPEIK
jgi:hypothetical protein